MKHTILSLLFTLSIVALATLILPAQQLDLEQFEKMRFRNIGPAGMSGRITAIDVDLRDKDHIYVGSASGGVWESQNGGITWKSIFDEQPTLSIGALEINQNNPSEIWAGTGEGNPRNSHNSGAGIFKTVDSGKTWKYMGLEETKLIHRVIVNTQNTDEVLVGAMGSAWGPSEHRGVYKTDDGGETWKQTLYVGEEVGVADMVVDPSNPNKIIAAMWEFSRKPWGFNSGGDGSGLYLSHDAGDTWKKLTYEEGLPKGKLGRMGIAFAPSKPNIVYALIETEKKNGLYKSSDGGEKWALVSDKNVGNRPFYYAELYVDTKNENRIYNLWSYVSRSEDGGKTFETIMDYGNNVHPDHHAFWIDPDDSNYLIDGNDGGLNISRDGGETWRFVTNLPVGQFYHVDVDNDFPYNVYGGMQDNGSWVGPGFVLKRGGITNHDWQELYFGDGFDVAPKKNDSRYGYAMSQQGNVGMWDRVTGKIHFIKPQHPEGEQLRFHWNSAMALDPFNDDGLYFGTQYVHKSADNGHSWKILSDDLTTNDTLKQDQSKSGGLTLDVTGAENYTTILCIAPSPHDEDEIWAGTDDGNLQLTRNGGKSWTNMNNKLSGLPKNAWIPQIVLSKQNKGEAFAVANNYRQNDWGAFLYHTTDGGVTWRRIIDDNDVDGFVLSVVQDHKNENLLFAGTDVGLYFSLDRGGSWQKWGKDLPSVQIRDMKIQEEFDDLVLGTFGRSFWVLDDIKPLRDLASDKKILDQDLKLFEPGTAYLTSSRSYQGIRFVAQGDFAGKNKSRGAMFTVWKKPSEKDDKTKDEMKTGEKNKNKKKAKGKKAKKDIKKKAAKKTQQKDKDAKGAVDDKADIDDEKDDKKKKGDEATVSVMDMNGDTIRTIKWKLKDGINRFNWSPNAKGVDYPRRKDPKEKSEPGGMPILPGTYKIVLKYKSAKDSTQLQVELDPRQDHSQYDVPAKSAAMNQFNETVTGVTTAYNNLKEAKKSMKLYKQLIQVQEDTIKKEYMKLHKEIGSEIDSLMNLYMLPEADKPGYRDDSHTLNTKLRNARRFISTSTAAPTPNGRYAVDTAEREAGEVVKGVNAFFETDWMEYLEKMRYLKLDIFKEFESVELGNGGR